MEKKTEKLNKGVNRIYFHVNEADFHEELEEKLKKLRKEIQLPGFRRGKVPKSLIRRQFEKSLIAEIINKKVQDALKENDEKINNKRYSDYVPGEHKLDFDNKDFQFVFDWYHEPEVRIDEEKIKAIPYYEAQIPDEYIEKKIKIGRYVTPKFHEVEKINDKTTETFLLFIPGKEDPYIVTYYFPILPDDESPKPLTKEKEYLKYFKGKKAGDTIKIPFEILMKYFPETDDGIVLNEMEIPGDTEVELKVNKILKGEPITEEEYLKQRLHLEEDPEKKLSLEEYKEKYKEAVHAQYKEQAEQLFHHSLGKNLREILQTDLPDDFFLRLYGSIFEEENDGKEYYEQNKPEISLEIAKEFILKENGEEITTNDILQAAFNDVISHYVQRGYDLPENEEDIIKIAAYLIDKDENYRNTIIRNLQLQRLLKILTEKYAPEKTPIDVEELEKKHNEVFYPELNDFIKKNDESAEVEKSQTEK